MVCKDAIVFLVFYVHQTNVKILIGQILRITQSVVLIGQQPVIQECRSAQIHSFNMLDNSRNQFEFIFVEETLRSLEENGVELMQRKEEQLR